MSPYRTMPLLLSLLIGCSLPGCASAPTPAPVGPEAEPEAPDLPAPPEGPSTAKNKTPKLASTNGLLVKTSEGVWAIRRGALQRIQKEGAQQFIQQVRVRPTFTRGRFYGWRVLAYRGPGKLRQGDVVRRVNGASIERPEQFMKVWEAMAERSRLEIHLVRQGREVRASWPIID